MKNSLDWGMLTPTSEESAHAGDGERLCSSAGAGPRRRPGRARAADDRVRAEAAAGGPRATRAGVEAVPGLGRPGPISASQPDAGAARREIHPRRPGELARPGPDAGTGQSGAALAPAH